MSRNIVIALATFLLFPAGALQAQETIQPISQSYVFFSPGWFLGEQASGEGSIEFGGGGERRLIGGLGVGGDVGYLFGASSFADGLGHASGSAVYYFDRPAGSQRTVPFVIGGVSAFFREGAAATGHLGGGVTRWLNDGVGLRFEVRDHFQSFDAAHLLQFRVGVSFR